MITLPAWAVAIIVVLALLLVTALIALWKLASFTADLFSVFWKR